MAAILNGLLPLRRKDQNAQDRILNTRWGDAGISAPIHGGWNAQSNSSAEPSPELDQDLPPTPPHYAGEQDAIYILHDDEHEHGSGDETMESERENASITITLPWKKKQKQQAEKRRSINNISGPRFATAQRLDLMPPPLATAEAAASIPLPDSRISSPVSREVISPIGRPTTSSPVLSFRSRMVSPTMGDMLSPVVEGFAKSGPSSRPTPVLSPLHYVQSVPLDRPPTASSIRSNGGRRPSLTSGNSYSARDEVGSDANRPPSRGLGATAHMRASSRAPRSNSTDPKQRRASSIDPADAYLEQSIHNKPVLPAVNDHFPLRSRAPSVEPLLRRRAPSVEPGHRRAPSAEPTNRRAASREPRGRQGMSVEPGRRRHHSEAPRKLARDSMSSNDASADSDSERETSDSELYRDFNAPRPRPRRRRSIASPMSSPIASSFAPAQTEAVQMDSIAARAGLIRPQVVPRPPLRNIAKPSTKGLYSEMQDDFRLLARDVRLDMVPVTTQSANNMVVSPITTPQLTGLSQISQRMPSPALSSHPTHASSGLAVAVAQRFDDPQGLSDSDAGRSRIGENHGGKMLLAALARDRKDQLRREERERARERVIRRMERERERAAAITTFSDCESIMSSRTAMSAAEKTRRVYGTSSVAGYDSDASLKSWVGKDNKELVKNAEEIWG